jgi:hypothetical protein
MICHSRGFSVTAADSGDKRGRGGGSGALLAAMRACSTNAALK